MASQRAQESGRARVLHVIETLGSGGAERLLHTNLKHLDSRRFESRVVTVFAEGTHWREPIQALGVSVESLDCRGPRDLPGAVSRLQRRLQEERGDLIHTHLWAANIVGRLAGKRSGAPVISSIHNPDYEPHTFADDTSAVRVKRRVVQALDRWTARRCRRMIAVSDYVRECAVRSLGFPRERIDLLYNPIDAAELLAPAGRTRPELLREWGLPLESLLLLNVGRVSSQKGFLYAVQALPAILKQHPEAHLLSVGAAGHPEWLERLQQEARTLGVAAHVHFLGPRRDVPDLLRACDLFVFPSLYEGLGIALAEAMAAGCACIATTTGPLPEILRQNVEGVLVPPADAPAFAAAVCELLGDPARRAVLGRAASASALAKFDPTLAARRLETIYETVLAAPGPSGQKARAAASSAVR